MTGKRMAGGIAAAFVVSEVLAVITHGFLLASDYAPFYGTLLRGQSGPAWQMSFLLVAHLSFTSALVWVYSRLNFEGGAWSQGVKLGFLAFLLGQVPVWLQWYAGQPWPGELVAKQLSLELPSSLVLGLTIAAVCGQRRAAARAPSAV